MTSVESVAASGGAPPVSVVSALRAKYAGDIEVGTNEELRVSKVNKRNNKSWSLVGMEKTKSKQSNLSRITVGVVDSSNITVLEATANELEEEALVRLEELNLANNHFTSLEQLAPLVARDPKTVLPRLALLQLTGNCLNRGPVMPGVFVAPAITKLVLDETGLPLDRALVEIVAPNLKELHLCGNGYETLALSKETLQLVKQIPAELLNLQGNNLQDAGDLFLPGGASNAVLGAVFPNLTALNVSANSNLGPLVLSAEQHQACHSGTALSPFHDLLREVHINDNPAMNDCRSLVALGSLFKLAVLRCSYPLVYANAPVVGLVPRGSVIVGEVQGRMLTIATIATLERLNGGVIRKKERTDSELFLLQRLMVQDAGRAEPKEQKEQEKEKAEQKEVSQESSSSQPQQQQQQTPVDDPLCAYRLRQAQLADKFKDVIFSGSGEGGEKSLGNFMVDITLRRFSATSDTTRSLPLNFPIGKLRALCQTVFSKQLPAGTTAADIVLKYGAGGDSGVLSVLMELEDDTLTIGYHGISNQAVIEVTTAAEEQRLAGRV